MVGKMGLLILQRRNRPRAGQRERGAGLHGAVRRPDLDPCDVTQSWAEQDLTPFCIALPRMPHGSLLMSPSLDLGEFRARCGGEPEAPSSFLFQQSVLWALGIRGSLALRVAPHPPSTLDSASRWATG